MTQCSRSQRRKRRPIVLTDRDRGLLRLVAEYGTLSTDHLRALCFRSPSRARKRLRLLWQHGFLRRHVRPVRMGEGSASYLYTLGRAANRYVRGDESDQSRRPPKRRPSRSEHTLRVAGFRIALTLALRHRSGVRLVCWRPGSVFRFTQSVTVGQGPRTVPIVPDSFFTLAADGREFHYCLEIDRGTTDLKRIRAKFQAYLNLWQSRAASTKLGIFSFRILYVTTTETRLSHMLEALRRLRSAHPRPDLIAITCFSRYSLDVPAKLLTPIFQTIGADDSTQHIRPFPTPPPVTLPIVPGNPPVSEPDVGAR